MTAVVEACISLGANLGDAQATVGQALACLAADPEISRLRASPLYRSAPWGRQDQPDFINACARVNQNDIRLNTRFQVVNQTLEAC